MEIVKTRKRKPPLRWGVEENTDSFGTTDNNNTPRRYNTRRSKQSEKHMQFDTHNYNSKIDLAAKHPKWLQENEQNSSISPYLLHNQFYGNMDVLINKHLHDAFPYGTAETKTQNTPIPTTHTTTALQNVSSNEFLFYPSELSKSTRPIYPAVANNTHLHEKSSSTTKMPLSNTGSIDCILQQTTDSAYTSKQPCQVPAQQTDSLCKKLKPIIITQQQIPEQLCREEVQTTNPDGSYQTESVKIPKKRGRKPLPKTERKKQKTKKPPTITVTTEKKSANDEKRPKTNSEALIIPEPEHSSFSRHSSPPKNSGRILNDSDYKLLRSFLRLNAQFSDKTTAFTGYYNHELVRLEQMIHIYEAGRAGVVPAVWIPHLKMLQEQININEYNTYRRLHEKYGKMDKDVHSVREKILNETCTNTNSESNYRKQIEDSPFYRVPGSMVFRLKKAPFQNDTG